MKRVLPLALLLIAGCSPIQAGVLGADSVGEPCPEPMGEICTNFKDDDGNGLIDCMDPQCTPGTKFLCDASGVVAPACQPILDDPARMVFRPTKPVDRFVMSARIVPTTQVDPGAVEFDIADVACWHRLLAGKHCPIPPVEMSGSLGTTVREELAGLGDVLQPVDEVVPPPEKPR